MNARENRRGNPEWTIQRHWQQWTHKTLDTNKAKNRNTENSKDILGCDGIQTRLMVLDSMSVCWHDTLWSQRKTQCTLSLYIDMFVYLTCYWLLLYYNVRDIDNLRTADMSIPWQSGQIILYLLQVNIYLCWQFSAMSIRIAMIYSVPNQGYSRNASCTLN